MLTSKPGAINKTTTKLNWGLLIHSVSFCFSYMSSYFPPSTDSSDSRLTEDNMAVEHRLPLFLDLPPPALLGVLHLVEHVGSGV